MTTEEREIIRKAERLGARFKRDGKTRWMWEGGDYSYTTRLDAAYEYLQNEPRFAMNCPEAFTIKT